MKAFDLNVIWDPETKEQLPVTLKALQDAGYGAVALNHIVEGRLPKTKCPFGRVEFPGRKESLSQYTRLTLIMDNPQQNLGLNMNNEIVRSYDFIAVQPQNEKMFQVACNSLDIDIISLDMSSRLAYPIRPGYVKVALERGVAFELCYGPMIQDAGARRHTIANSMALLRFAKGGRRGVIVSSGATSPWQIRAPADVMNLAGLLGVPPQLRKSVMTMGPHQVFVHAGSRTHSYRGAAVLMPTEEAKAVASTDMLEDFIKLC